jgi:hypothetical protein
MLNKACIQHLLYLSFNLIFEYGCIPIRSDADRSSTRYQRYCMTTASGRRKSNLCSKDIEKPSGQYLGLIVMSN